jgi:hypothetical protein
VSRETLLQEVWAYNSGVTTHTIETHIYRLRQKIEKDAAVPAFLITEGGGYTRIHELLIYLGVCRRPVVAYGVLALSNAEGRQMPRYSFSIRAGDESARIMQIADLSDDTSALAYASDLGRSLQQRRENVDVGWLIKVSDDKRAMVFALPILAACA